MLGLIYADGCLINDKHSGREKVNITSKDKDIIEAISKYVGSKHSIYYNRGCFSMLFCNEDSIKILKEKYGLHQRKSKDITFPNIDKEFLPDFIRGYFDGDGSIAKMIVREKYMYMRITFTSGSVLFLKQLKTILETELKIYPHFKKDSRRETYYLDFSKKRVNQKFWGLYLWKKSFNVFTKKKTKI